MRLERVTIAIGIIVVVLGVIFHLQGQAIIGPQSSFMYSNPTWITYGIQIVIFGIIIIGTSILVRKLRSQT